MANPEFVVVYDIRQEGLHWILTAVILFPLCFGLLYLFRLLAVLAARRKRSEKIWQAGLCVFVIIVVTLWAFRGCSDYGDKSAQREQAARSLESGEYLTVEGQVTDFRTGFRGGGERFTVHGVRFSYAYSDLTRPGFHRDASHGGPVRQGLYVRIRYRPTEPLPPQILEIEVRK